MDLQRFTSPNVNWGPNNIPPRWQKALHELSVIVATFHCGAIEEVAVSMEDATRDFFSPIHLSRLSLITPGPLPLLSYLVRQSASQGHHGSICCQNVIDERVYSPERISLEVLGTLRCLNLPPPSFS